MYDLEDLYQEIVMDHNRRPRNFKKLENAQRTAEGFNPLCGDQISLYLNVDDDGVIEDIGFEGAGCAISKATASMMTEAIKGKNVDKAEEIFEAFRHMLTRKPEEEYDYELLGDLEILQGVSQFPTRIKCATLSWHTLNSALDGKQPSGQKTSTE
ncbi:MAG TPA: SUF system NifU family Fe-S cluster assembly protein [Dehalococcoidia bacterium]|jgi:nitrogen fixation NifU-like protein|nr:SUF system NifU family Fe-S cluster assembly protein [SAR202 cluster bacterium]PCH92588.1 MAG: SUF system NifU family Fe-S cluster assembly protein [Dehalococcoidia bacterium]HBD84906.1 SUF system NifU family Fe-S cluster assembly protein [Dehalococcoidia bacterium]HBJ32218.1 SUF system NifU family Fe-S cluster assembly protein [Dehalococcoidia bacterium]HIM18709.1 SUF system NifU family Fe-S cluster assembly protein [Dehalococcoidia bacterium]